MELQNIQWKIHFKNSDEIKSHEWFRVFNSWIPDSPEIFIDVADYSHVEDGPVILLPGHTVSYSLDATGRRLGLLYDRRQPLLGSNSEKLQNSLRDLLKAAARLESDATFDRKPNFLLGDLKFVVNNRALVSNTDAALTELRPELEALLAKLYGNKGYEITRDADPKQRFTLTIQCKISLSMAEALTRLQ